VGCGTEVRRDFAETHPARAQLGRALDMHAPQCMRPARAVGGDGRGSWSGDAVPGECGPGDRRNGPAQPHMSAVRYRSDTTRNVGGEPGGLARLAADVVDFGKTHQTRPQSAPADADPGALLDQALVHGAARRALDESGATPADHSEASAQRERRQALQKAPAREAAVHFLARGPYANWAENAQIGARIAWWAGLAPLAYFGWTALALAPRSAALSGLGTISLNIVMALVGEVIFWVSAGFAFAGLYPLLPGRIGPTKALALWLAWIAFRPMLGTQPSRRCTSVRGRQSSRRLCPFCG
jgi:Family of unknown function (DUF6185)